MAGIAWRSNANGAPPKIAALCEGYTQVFPLGVGAGWEPEESGVAVGHVLLDVAELHDVEIVVERVGRLPDLQHE